MDLEQASILVSAQVLNAKCKKQLLHLGQKIFSELTDKRLQKTCWSWCQRKWHWCRAYDGWSLPIITQLGHLSQAALVRKCESECPEFQHVPQACCNCKFAQFCPQDDTTTTEVAQHICCQGLATSRITKLHLQPKVEEFVQDIWICLKNERQQIA